MKRIAVLASGQGSNLAALIRAEQNQELGGWISLVLSDRPNVGALDHGKAHGCSVHVIRPRDFPDREAWDTSMAELLAGQSIDFVVCAGFRRVLGSRMLAAFPRRIVNIHPSLLPSFPGGLHAQADALEHGVKFSGCSVHFVTSEVDAGPIIAQAVVPIFDDDTVESLADRILHEEHRILPASVRLLVEGRLAIEGRRVRLCDSADSIEPTSTLPNLERALAPHLGA